MLFDVLTNLVAFPDILRDGVHLVIHAVQNLALKIS